MIVVKIVILFSKLEPAHFSLHRFSHFQLREVYKQQVVVSQALFSLIMN